MKKIIDDIDLKNQFVEIRLTDESGKIIKKSEINFFHILNSMYKLKKFQEKYIWTSTIDCYGNTCFNRMQIPFLIKELKELSKEKIDSSLKDKINETIIFVKQISEKYHTYIVFLGD